MNVIEIDNLDLLLHHDIHPIFENDIDNDDSIPALEVCDHGSKTGLMMMMMVILLVTMMMFQIYYVAHAMLMMIVVVINPVMMSILLIETPLAVMMIHHISYLVQMMILMMGMMSLFSRTTFHLIGLPSPMDTPKHYKLSLI